MTDNEIKYMQENQFALDKYLLLNPFLTKMAMKLPGAGVSVIEIEDPDGVKLVGPGCSVVFKKWADKVGLTEAYQEHQGDVQEATEKTFAEGVEAAKESITPATPAEAFEAPEPPSQEVPDVPDAPEPNADVDTRYDTLEKRKAFLHSKGWMYFSEEKGYLNKEKNRWIDENIVVTIDDSRAFLNAFERSEATEYTASSPVEEKAPSIVPTEEDAPKMTLAQETEIKQVRTKVLTDNGYVRDPATYKYEKEGHVVSQSDIAADLDKPWAIEAHIKKLEAVPAEIKEIAAASDNVIIASTTINDFKSKRKLRIAKLIGEGADFDIESNEIKHGATEFNAIDLDNMDEEAFNKLFQHTIETEKKLNPKVTEGKKSLQIRMNALTAVGWEMNFEKGVLQVGDSPLTISEADIMEPSNDNWADFLTKKTRVAENIKIKAAERAEEKAVNKEVNSPEVVESDEPVAIVEQKIYTEKELSEIKDLTILEGIIKERKITISEEGRNTNKKLRTLILDAQPKPEPVAAKEESKKTTTSVAEKKSLENVVVAPDNIGDLVNFMNKLSESIKLFEKSQYFVSQIADILSYDDIAEDEKLLQISNALDNYRL